MTCNRISRPSPTIIQRMHIFCLLFCFVFVSIAHTTLAHAQTPDPVTPITPTTSPTNKEARLRLLESEIARIQDETGTIRSAVGWTFMGIGTGFAILGTMASYVFINAVSSDNDNGIEPSDDEKTKNFGFAILLGLGSGSFFLIPGILTYVIPSDDETLPEAYFAQKSAPNSPPESLDITLARAESTLENMSDSARYRRLALAWSLVGVGTAQTLGVAAMGLFGDSDRTAALNAAGSSALLYGGLATWQFLTTWDAEDTWQLFQNSELPQLESSHFQWALSPSVSPDGTPYLSFSLVH
jgi:hypothetical protein